jgi:two-component system KDP operon response regulator KdpE
MSKPTILIVDDELQIRRFLRIGLESNDYSVVEVSTGKDAVMQASMVHPDAVILDLGLPDMTGIQVLKQIREWSSVPVIILSVLDREEDKIEALDNGADDYVTKPFSIGELLARLRVALRHVQPIQESSEFTNGQMTVDFASRIVKVNGAEVKLTATEYSLLMLFIKHAGKVLTHRQILREIWGIHAVDHTQYLRVYMAQLRKKLEADPLQPKIFITESGVGYRMVLAEE